MYHLESSIFLAGIVALLLFLIMSSQNSIAQAGDGVTGEYFNNTDLSGSPATTRVDPQINFNYGQSGPSGTPLGNDNFSIRWTGMLEPQYSEVYEFCTTSDDGARLFVNGVRVVDRWAVQPATEFCGRTELTAGEQVWFRLEYFEQGVDAEISVRWESDSQAKEVIPQSALFSQTVGEEPPITDPLPPDPPDSYYTGKFAPPDGQNLLIVGQDLDSVAGYVQGVGTPGGTTTYCDIAEQNQAYILYGCREPHETVDYGAGPINAHENLRLYPNSVLAMGLYMVDDSGQNLNKIADGTFDNYIDHLANLFKEDGRPIFLRIGYEFDGPWNHYDPNGYIAAYRHIVDRFEFLGVDNVAYVWQAATWQVTTGVGQWYPGDEYVDWTGVSYFVYTPAPYDEMLEFSRLHNKPMLVSEAAPQGFDLNDNTRYQQGSVTDDEIWYGWYDGFFYWLQENADVVRGVAYINADWKSQAMWGDLWGDTRIETNAYIEQRWLEKVDNDGWLNASPDLFNILEQAPDLTNPGVPATATPSPTTDPNVTPTNTPVATEPPGDDDFGWDYVNDTTIRLWHIDRGWTGGWNYMCLNGGCYPGTLTNGRYEREFGNMNCGQSYNIEFKVQDNATGQYLTNKDIVFTCGGPTSTPIPPTATATNAPPTATATATSIPPTATSTPVNPPTATATSVSPTATATSVPPTATATSVPPTATATQSPSGCSGLGIAYVNNNTLAVYQEDQGWTGGWNYVCLNGACYTGTLSNGFYQREFSGTLGQSYNIEVKIQDNATGQYIVSGQDTFTADSCQLP